MIFVSILMTSQENYMEAKGEVKAKGKMTEEAGNNENKLQDNHIKMNQIMRIKMMI